MYVFAWKVTGMFHVPDFIDGLASAGFSVLWASFSVQGKESVTVLIILP